MKDNEVFKLLEQYGDAMFHAGKLCAHLELHLTKGEEIKNEEPIEFPSKKKPLRPLIMEIVKNEGSCDYRKLIETVGKIQPGTTADSIRTSIYGLVQKGKLTREGNEVKYV